LEMRFRELFSWAGSNRNPLNLSLPGARITDVSPQHPAWFSPQVKDNRELNLLLPVPPQMPKSSINGLGIVYCLRESLPSFIKKNELNSYLNQASSVTHFLSNFGTALLHQQSS
jgi:hypothetical protein